MFSPDEQKQIQAESLRQWQEKQRTLKEALYNAGIAQWLGLPAGDPMFTFNDRRLLKQLHISPA